MIVLIGQGSGDKVRRLFDERPYLGSMMSPSRRPSSWMRLYALDNDVFAHRDDPGWWKREGETAWLRMLDAVPSVRPPLFAVLPDAVCDWRRTLDRAHRYRDELAARNIPAAIALQNGAEEDWSEALAVYPAFAFVGGDRAWKWRYAREITEWFHWRDVRVHVGRASGPLRIRRCMELGVDSCDGTGWARYSNKMLPRLLAALDGRGYDEHLSIPLMETL